MAGKHDDEVLVGRFRRGDEAAFDEIVALFQNKVAALANRLLGWPGDVDDVCQEVFLAVYLNLKRFRGQSSLKSWMYAITLNKCRSRERKRLWRIRKLNQATPDSQAGTPCGLEKETLRAVHRGIRRLPIKYREPIVLKYLQELPTDQVCRILGISRNTLNVRLSRARQQLKRTLPTWTNEL
jgi:RNA polymerase sigma-70 factor, ECF subfamily